jgi:hypothetical protein
MLRSRFIVIGLVLIAGMLLLSSCAQVPEKEMQAAREAVANATNAESDIYAQDLFVAAQDSLNQAEMLLSEKKYADAKRLALFAKSWADTAAVVAVANKEQMKTSAETAVNEAGGKLEALKKVKIPAKMKGEIKTCESYLTEAKSALEAGDYRKASDMANDILSRIAKIEEGMQKK